MDAPRRVELPDGRTLAYDDVGDPAGLPVVYLHGTPDSRLARHPDDEVTAAAGVRLVAVDRPGAGLSDLDPHSTLTSLGKDLEVLLDALAIDRAALLGWSAGGLFALAAASVLGDRIPAVGLVGTLPPVEAYDDPAVTGALGEGRRQLVEMAAGLPPDELADELAPYLVPTPLTEALALEHVQATAGERGREELAGVEGAAAQLARALEAAVHQGIDGLRRDLALQLERGLDLGAVTSAVRCIHGTDDPISPPAVGAWLVAHLPHGVLDPVPDAGHHLLFPRWRTILRTVMRDAGAG